MEVPIIFVGNTMKIKRFLALLCTAAFGTILFSGCASRSKLDQRAIACGHSHQRSTAHPPRSEENDSAQIAVIIDDADIDSLINGAQFACTHQDFEAAHMLLKEALVDLKIIQSGDSGWAESEDYYDRYYKEIARTYSQLMPSRFNDSLPEEISVAAMQGQLALSFFDSIRVPASDSLLLQKILSQKKTTYNFPMALNDRVYKALYSEPADGRARSTDG